MTSADRVQSRASHPLPEELRAGTEDLKAQARTLLEESDQRQESSDAAPDSFVEHRRSDETVDP